MIYLENLNEFDCTLKIKTAHKTIEKQVSVKLTGVRHSIGSIVAG
jgi:hypothetical protein